MGDSQVDELRIESGFMKDLISKVIKRLLRKNLGTRMKRIELDDVKITQKNGEVMARFTIEASMSTEDLYNLIAKNLLKGE